MQYRVLIVDDDADARTLLSLQLQEAGYVVHLARDAIEALEKIPEIDPHVIVTDHWMPGVLGIELAERVREFSDVPIVVYSAQATVDICNEAHKNGALEFLEYGDALGRLSDVISSHLGANGSNPTSAMSQEAIAARHRADEARRLEAMLIAHGGSVRRTAAYLGLHRQTLDYRLKKLGLKKR